MQSKFCSQMMAIFAVLTVGLALVPDVLAAPKYSVLYNFKGSRDGLSPEGGLVTDAAGNFYGVTTGGGDGKNGECGTVFELKRVKGSWAHNVLYRFPSNGKDGCAPATGLVFDTKGDLYGTTFLGGGGGCGGRGCGTVFELAPSAGGTWRGTVLHRFVGGQDGESPGYVVLGAGDEVFGGDRAIVARFSS